VKDLRRASRGLTQDGVFRGAGFKDRPSHAETTGDHWTFLDNPFAGTRELSGLMILMTMINNWDLTRANTAVLREKKPDGTTELRYLVSDLGASFGHMENVRLPWSVFSMYPWTKWNVPGTAVHRWRRQWPPSPALPRRRDTAGDPDRAGALVRRPCLPAHTGPNPTGV
jgi:hypothetical protein